MPQSTSGDASEVLLNHSYFKRHQQQGTITAVRHLLSLKGPYVAERIWRIMRETLGELEDADELGRV